MSIVSKSILFLPLALCTNGFAFDKTVVIEVIEVVRLRYISGLTIKQTAVAFEVSDRTVVDNWEYARAFLRGEMSEANQ